MCVAGMVEKFREGKATKDEVLLGSEIFKDCKTGDRPSATELESAFGTSNIGSCIDELLEKGEFQLTAAERKQKTDEKLAQILTFIHRNYLDPGTNLPHPLVRIESVVKAIKGLKVDPFRSAESQAIETVKRIKDVLPLAKSEMEGMLTVPINLVGAIGGPLAKVCTVKKESITADEGHFSVTFLPGDHDRVLAELSRATKGQFELKIVGAGGGGGGGGGGGRSGSPAGAKGDGPRSGSPRGGAKTKTSKSRPAGGGANRDVHPGGHTPAQGR